MPASIRLSFAFLFASAPVFAQDGVIAFKLIDSAPGPQPGIEASSIPQLGQLYPLSSNFSINGAGNVGIGTPFSNYSLDVFNDVYNSNFQVFDFNPGAGTHLIAGLTSGAGFGAQMRFSGAGGGFIDIGQDGGGSFVVEGDDAPRLTVTNDGRASVNFPVYSNVQLGMSGPDSFAFYSSSTNAGDAFTAGVFGTVEAVSSAGWGAGVWGKSVDPGRAGVFAEGDLGASGTKSFVQPHPTDASKQINFVCLEGNESGTYFRGKIDLAAGQAIVEVPEDFRLVSEQENLTVQLTAMGNSRVWLESYDLNRIVIGGTSDVEVHYMVNGVRRGYADHETIRDNVVYVPRNDDVYGTQYPQGIRDMLVENGTLNPDGTPNLDTAARLGWRLDIEPKAKTPVAVEQR